MHGHGTTQRREAAYGLPCEYSQPSIRTNIHISKHNSFLLAKHNVVDFFHYITFLNLATSTSPRTSQSPQPFPYSTSSHSGESIDTHKLASLLRSHCLRFPYKLIHCRQLLKWVGKRGRESWKRYSSGR